jgi:predicted porin
MSVVYLVEVRGVVFMKNTSLSALLAAGLLAGGMSISANAADLGGNCCADLEERIAELEATTARKGNRKVSLTISGWVAQQVTFWDDGIEKNAYISDIGTTLASHVKFTGSAKISPDWSAGYVLHIEAISNEPLGLSQTNDNSVGARVGVLQSFWFLKSESLGKLSVGLQSSAADNVAILPDGSGSLIAANYVLFDNNGFNLVRKTGAGLSRSAQSWGQLATCGNLQLGVSADCDGVPNNNVRYDTPTFGGFSASASWGEDDIWAVAGRYAGEFSGVKLALAAAYTESTDNSVGGANPVLSGGQVYRRSAAALQIGAYVQHVPTGLFVYGAYGQDYNDGLQSPTERLARGVKTDGDNFYVKAGVRTKLSPLGATVFFGEYGENNDKQSLALFQQGVASSSISQWGLGVVQEIDAAAMSLWVVYRNFSAEQNCVVGNANADCTAVVGAGLAGKVAFEDLQILKVGGIINF